MNSLTLRSSSELEILSSQLSITQEELKSKIIENLLDNEVISGDQCDCGKVLTDIIDYNSFKNVINDIFGGMSYILLLNLSIQVLVSTLGNCPECGCELEEIEQQLQGYKWIDKKCNNCSYADTGEPDWDTMQGGYSYDC